MSGLRTLLANERAFVGVWNDVVITVWRGDVEAEDVRYSARAQALAGPKGQPFGAIAFVEPDAMRISEPARKEAARVTEEGGARLVGIGVVLPVGGFRGAIARTVATGVHLLSGSAAPQKMFERIPDAAAWVIERLGHSASRAEELAGAVQTARATRS